MSTPVRRALYGRLSGDTILTNLLGTAASGYTKAIYHAQAPQDATYPLIIINKQSGVPMDTFGEPGALNTDVWLIKAVDQSPSANNAEAISARLQVLLNDATLSISGALLVYLRRESDVEYVESVESLTYCHCGSLYRLVTT
jgi:hypothetical protein